jgi:hypothetical protein
MQSMTSCTPERDLEDDRGVLDTSKRVCMRRDEVRSAEVNDARVSNSYCQTIEILLILKEKEERQIYRQRRTEREKEKTNIAH